MKTKVVASAAEALAERVKDGMTIAVGGFGLSGIPTNLIRALRDSGAIPVQCHVALRGTGGIFANPSGREGGRVCCMRVSVGRRP